MCKGRTAEARAQTWDERTLGELSHAEEIHQTHPEEGEYWDSSSGAPLQPSLVQQARMEEILQFRKHGVYQKVPVRECWERTGKAPIGIKWVDVNKGDEEKPEYRSRLVAKQN